MRIINGLALFTVGDCSAFTGKSVQTIHKYDKYSDILESNGEERLVPRPIRINGQRLYTKEQVKEIQQFIESKKHGLMTEYNRKRLGKRVKEQEIMHEEKNEKELEGTLSKVNRAVNYNDRFKYLKKNL